MSTATEVAAPGRFGYSDTSRERDSEGHHHLRKPTSWPVQESTEAEVVTETLSRAANHVSELTRYFDEIRRFPMLEPDEEYVLARRSRDHGHADASHRLVTSHLRLVTRIAMRYRGYGLPIGEVISEGNIGLIQAVKRFEPDRGFRLATYAMWWIRASIQEYILRSWSLVKMGTTAAQKKLFFNLRRMKGQIRALEDRDLQPEVVKHIATKLGVPENDVVIMNRRLGGDVSLNAPVCKDELEGEGEWVDWLADDTPDQEERLAESDELNLRKIYLAKAMLTLTDREKRIFEARRLADEPGTLEDLSAEFGVSRERIRQIEARAFEKVQSAVHEAAKKSENHTAVNEIQ
jgi:RNA polymerase sigma-32 factor